MVGKKLEIGATGELVFTATQEHAIDFAVDGMPSVLSTPWLIWFMEHSARNAVLPFLEPGESTVGVNVNIDHLAATPLGHQVTCRAQLVQRDGKSLWFRLEAFDEHEQIAKGLHNMRIIDVARFAHRVAGKEK